MIGNKFNFEDTFFRDLTVCVLDTLESQIKWVNRFSSGDYPVNVPFYYSLTGDERFLLDSFHDDIVSENRYIELNTDIIPRGHITLTSFNILSDEFANPNVWLKTVVENESEIRKLLTRIRAIPVSVNYDLEIKLSTEIDVFKCNQAILDTLWLYKYMYFEYNFMNIDAVMTMPDSNSIEINRDKDLSSDNNISLKVSFEVNTYYPAFRQDRIDMPSYSSAPTGDGMTDMNGHHVSGGFSDYFTSATSSDGPLGSNMNIIDSKDFFGDSFSWPLGSNPGEGYYNIAKRTKWYENILKARESNKNNNKDLGDSDLNTNNES